MSRKAGAGFAAVAPAGMNAVRTKDDFPYGPPYETRMRLRTAWPSIITRSGPSAAKERSDGRSTGRFP